MTKEPTFRLRPEELIESDIVKECLYLLRNRGYWMVRQHSGRFCAPGGSWITIGEPGLPDWAAVHGIYPGFLLEAKRPRSGPKPHQGQKISEIQTGYRLAICVVDSPAALRLFLDEHERKARERWKHSQQLPK